MSAPMNILFVSEPGLDGVFRIVERLAQRLVARGHRLHLAYSDRRGSPQLDVLVAHVAASGGETLNLGVGNAPAPRDALALARLWALARRVRPDVIHAHSSKAGVLGRTLALLGIRARFFYSPHAYYGLGPTPGRNVALYNGIERLFGKIGETVPCSEDEKRFAIRTLGIPEARLHVLFNNVDGAVFRPADAATRRAARRAARVPENAVVLGSLGRLCFQKDPQTLYRAVAPVLERHPELHLLHLGRGELEPEIAALAAQLGIAQRITRLPFLAEPENFYAACDAFFLPSRYEGLPVAVIEALACDLPLILSTGPGFSDFPKLGLSHCWSAPPEDAEGFSRALAAWLADRAAGRASNHRALAAEHFDPERCVDRLVAIYRGEPLSAS